MIIPTVIPTLRFVFDRKKVATRQKKGLVQIEVCFRRERKWIGTGVKVYADQWNDRFKVINSTDMIQLNERLDMQMHSLQEFVNDLARHGAKFTFDKLNQFIADSSRSDSFVDFLRIHIDNRSDIRDSTKKQHRTLITVLEEFRHILSMDDLTRDNIKRFDGFLRRKGLTQPTVANYHKRMKVYINEAIRDGYITGSPYVGIKIDKGKSSRRKYLSEEDMQRLADCAIPSLHIDNARDLFMFQCYTGLSYADLAKIDFSKDLLLRDGRYIIFDSRQKTDEDYYIVLIKPAVSILQKHGFKLPKMSNQKYNDYIKVAAQYAGIDKPLTTHCARHTFAVFALNHGVPIEVVAKMLGHANIRTTQIYAKILSKNVEKGFDTIERSLGGV